MSVYQAAGRAWHWRVRYWGLHRRVTWWEQWAPGVMVVGLALLGLAVIALVVLGADPTITTH